MGIEDIERGLSDGIPCTCGHQQAHHVQGVACDEKGDAIGMVEKCLGEEGCQCMRYTPQGFVEQYVSRDEAQDALRLLHAHACLTGTRYTLLMHSGGVATMHSNAPSGDHALQFAERIFDDHCTSKTTEVVERWVEPEPLKNKEDERRFVLIPPILMAAWEHYEPEPDAPYGPQDEEENEDEDEFDEEDRASWQHISSDGDAHTFQHSATGERRTVEGFATLAEAEAMLGEPLPCIARHG